jgi:hypothetical protein
MAKATTLKIIRYKSVNGVEVRPVMYVGSSIGESNYMAGCSDSGLVVDKAGKPVPYKMIKSD